MRIVSGSECDLFGALALVNIYAIMPFAEFVQFESTAPSIGGRGQFDLRDRFLKLHVSALSFT